MRRTILALLLLAGPAAVRAEDAIAPLEATKKIGEKVVVEMEVKSSKLLDSGICYLNSNANFKDKENLTIFLPKSTVEKFKGSKIDDPSVHFKGKKVRITGVVTPRNGQAQIKIDNVDQLKLVDN